MQARSVMKAATVLVLAMGAALPARAQEVAQLSWPRTRIAPDGMQVTLFQPQVDSWSYYVVLNYHMAVELQLPGASSSVPGALFMTGETSTDLNTQTVALYNQKIVRVNFPGLDPATAQQYQSILQSLVPTGTMNLSLAQVQSYVAASNSAAATSGAPPAPIRALPACRQHSRNPHRRSTTASRRPSWCRSMAHRCWGRCRTTRSSSVSSTRRR